MRVKILLIKPETVGIFCYTSQVEHEPLEMEYLKTLFEQNGYDTFIYDRRYDLTSLRKKLKSYRPDIVCITGYITQQKNMIRFTRIIKAFDSSIQIIIGGSNAELNYENYFVSDTDYIYHLSGLANLLKLVDFISGKENAVKDLHEINGICFRENGEWCITPKIYETPADLPIPDRRFFYDNIKHFRYMNFRPLALVKNSYSCKKACTFCFCTNRNSGRYACRPVESLVAEIETLDVPCIHITDDDFLIDEEYLREFVRLLREKNIHKKYLIYGRADFIAEHEELMQELAEVGLALVMVGLEATDNKELDFYNKKTSIRQNEECIRILHQCGIICAGLFIVHQGMTKADFKHLCDWISAREIMPTISVFTPMQGTAIYKQYQEKMLTQDVTKQDLFHCLLKPEHMSVCRFTFEYYKLSIAVAWKKRHCDLYSEISFWSASADILRAWFIKLKRLFSF